MCGMLRVSLTEGFFFLFPLLLAGIWMHWLERKQSSWTVKEFGKEAMQGGTKRYKTEATRKEPYHTALHAHPNIYVREMYFCVVSVTFAISSQT